MDNKKAIEYNLIIGGIMFAIILLATIVVGIKVWGLISGNKPLDPNSKNNINRLSDTINSMEEGERNTIPLQFGDDYSLRGGKNTPCGLQCLCLCPKDGCEEKTFIKKCFDREVVVSGGGIGGSDNVMMVFLSKTDKNIEVGSEMTLSGYGNVPESGTCTSSAQCSKGYCSKGGYCIDWKKLGEPCVGVAIDGDDYACARYVEVARCDSGSGDPEDINYYTDKCIAGKGLAPEGEYCTANWQCPGKLHCACAGWSTELLANTPENKLKNMGPKCLYGTCEKKATIGFACDGWNVNDPDMACESGICNEGKSDNFCDTP